MASLNSTGGVSRAPYGRRKTDTGNHPPISRADLVDYHHRHYGPQDMVITVVGAVTPEQVLEEATRTFGDWENPNPNSLPALPVITSPAETLRRHINIPGKFQTDLMIGSLGPCRNSPDYLPASLGNSVLGQFGMMGRIGEAVREKSGPAYTPPPPENVDSLRLWSSPPG